MYNIWHTIVSFVYEVSDRLYYHLCSFWYLYNSYRDYRYWWPDKGSLFGLVCHSLLLSPFFLVLDPCVTCSAIPGCWRGWWTVRCFLLPGTAHPSGLATTTVGPLVGVVHLLVLVVAHTQMQHFWSKPEVTRPRGTLIDAGPAFPVPSELACHGVWTCLRLDSWGECWGAMWKPHTYSGTFWHVDTFLSPAELNIQVRGIPVALSWVLPLLPGDSSPSCLPRTRPRAL